MNRIIIFLMIDFFWLNIIDSCTTIVLLSRTDMAEQNPIMAMMFSNGIIIGIIFKMVFVSTMILGFYMILEKVEISTKPKTAKIVTCVAELSLLSAVIFFTITVINNISLL